jgi:hypothetical protein
MAKNMPFDMVFKIKAPANPKNVADVRSGVKSRREENVRVRRQADTRHAADAGLLMVETDRFIWIARTAKILLWDQSDSTCPALSEKILLFRPDPNHLHIRSRPASLEGRIAIVTDVERGMRWTWMGR